MTSMKKSLLDRFAEKVALDDNGCLIWLGAHTGARANSDYGLMSVDRQRRVAHHVAWFLEFGRWPKPGLEIDHVLERGCRSTLCVNVEHLEEVTPQKNNRRRRRGWTPRKNPDLCSKGLHPWVPDNLIEKGGYLTCKRCYYDRNNEWHHRQKGKT